MVYRWREGTRWRAKAQEVGERLEHLRAEHGGTITPQSVVEDARHEASPLHRAFEWDDEKAAAMFRVDQARQLIADVMVVYSEVEGAPKDPIRAFASLSNSGMAYTSMREAVESPELRAVVLGQAKKELEGWRRRYKQYQELAAAVDAVNKALETLNAA